MASLKSKLFEADDLINDPFSNVKQGWGRLIIYNVCISLKKGRSLDDEYIQHETTVPMFRREQEHKMQQAEKKPAKRTKK